MNTLQMKLEMKERGGGESRNKSMCQCHACLWVKCVCKMTKQIKLCWICLFVNFSDTIYNTLSGLSSSSSWILPSNLYMLKSYAIKMNVMKQIFSKYKRMRTKAKTKNKEQEYRLHFFSLLLCVFEYTLKIQIILC